MNPHKTQIGRMIEEVKKAMLAHFPIVYIPTNQKTLIDDMLFDAKYTGCLMPRVCFDVKENSDVLLEPGAFITEDGKPITDNYIIVTSSVGKRSQRPSLFVWYTSDLKRNSTMLDSFIADYYKIKSSGGYAQNDEWEKTRRSLYIVVTPTEEEIPASLAPYVYTVRVGAISDEEIEYLIFSKLDEYGVPHNVLMEKNSLFNQMKVSFRGLSALRIRQLMDLLIASQCIDFNEVTEKEVLLAINETKKQMLANIPGLKWENTEAADAVGLGWVTGWLDRHAKIFDDPKRAKQQFVDIPGAILLTGIPGSGKSLMAKTTARKLGNIPLISLDMGALRDKYQGESEHNMIVALHTAEQMAPCVLWLDEIEKAFGSSDSNGDDGVGQRLFGKFLTWMQEKTSACFVFATSNNVTKLPPELFRSERFDRKFFTFMPTAHECAQIFVGNLKHQNDCYQKELLKYGKHERMRDGIPNDLFPGSLLDESVWLKVLDECVSDNPDECLLVKKKREADNLSTYYWASMCESDDKMCKPANKLLTGADISSIIKEAKFNVNSNLSPVNKRVVYEHDTFIAAIKDVLKNFRPYGETNLRNIAECFYLLYVNQFEPASMGEIFAFKAFNEDKLIYTPEEGSYGETKNEATDRYHNSKMRKYDYILNSTIVGAINYYLPKSKIVL